MLVISDGGIAYMLELIRAGFNLDGMKAHLFASNLTPDRTTTLAALLAAEADFDGYAPIAVASWVSVTVGGHVGITTPDLLQWTKSAGSTPNNVYGGFITDSGNTVLLWSERDPLAPTLIGATGDRYTWQLAMTDQNLPGVP